MTQTYSADQYAELAVRTGLEIALPLSGATMHLSEGDMMAIHAALRIAARVTDDKTMWKYLKANLPSEDGRLASRLSRTLRHGLCQEDHPS